METVFAVFYKSKTRMSDDVRSQPWHIESVWEDRVDAVKDKERMEREITSHDFDIQEVDFYRKGRVKPF
jgi:hypothetical protein